MIIWIDGSYGISKTKVATEVKNHFSDCDADLLLSDYYHREFMIRLGKKAETSNLPFNWGGTLVSRK